MFVNLTQRQKGILMIATGCILLFHTMGILEKLLGYLIVTASLALIGFGFYIADFMSLIMKNIKK